MNYQKGFMSFPILIMIVLGVVVLGGGAYYIMMQNQIPPTPTYQEQTYTPPAATKASNSATTQPQKNPTSQGTSNGGTGAGWTTYSNGTYSIQYPSNRGWVYEVFGNGGVSFGTPMSKSGGYIWTVGVSDKSVESLSTLIARMGDQFSDRKETQENLTINGVPALLVTVTTNQVNNWVAKMVYIERGNNIYWMSNGAVDEPAYATFYNSFKFTN